ncbi:MAG: hypothetical protein ACFE75_05660 [Candidatus Hodarchaeota archaeon]
MRARACIKCREYIVIHPSNAVNQVEIKKFEKKHLSHTIMTVDFNEIKGIYSSFKNHAADEASPEVD